MRLLHADAIFTGNAGTLRDGAVVVDEGGRVSDVGQATELLPRHAGLTIERIRGVLLPGLVNAHTHLELSALRGHVPQGGGFLRWVAAMMGVRAELLPEQDAPAISRAVAELRAFGTTAVGDITNSLAAVQALADEGIVGCVFHELFGPKREAFDANYAAAVRSYEERRAALPPSLAYGRTPHTLYTTSRQGVEQLVREARSARTRLSLHLSEHAAERRYLEAGDGPIADWYARQFGLSANDLGIPRMSPVHFAHALGLVASDTLLVHLTDARKNELRLIAEHGAHAVLCPRSNLYIEERLPPLLDVLDAGIEPALGTDSLASNTSLDVLEEAHTLLGRFPSVSKEALLRMATWNGARALGRPDLGRVERGASPELFAIRGEVGDDAPAFVFLNLKAEREWMSVRKGQKGA